MGNGDIPTRRNGQVADFLADCALPGSKPPQEIPLDCSKSGGVERGDNVEIDDVGSIE
jgi:hypothetical protein